jgi:signal transduction histidine kinase
MRLRQLSFRFSLWNLLILVITLSALTAIIVNLRAVDQHRTRLYRALTFEVGTAAMNNIRAQDDFPARRTMIVISIGIIAVLLAGIIALLQLLDQTNQRLQNEERWKSEMISAITHNANHYLAVIKGRIDLLAMKQEEGAPVTDLKKDLNMMGDNAASLSRLIDNLNKNELLEKGRLSVWPEPVDLAAMIHGVLASFAGLLAETGVQVSFTPPAAARVLADRHLLEQVLMNLVHNAIKYSRAGGTITIRLEPEDRRVRALIGDQGPGIAPEHWDRIFTPFVRLQPATRGAGLGLSNARRLIRLLGGELGVAKSIPGVGSTFYFTLPMAE